MAEAIREGDIPGVQLRCRVALPVAPGEVWQWLVEPAKLGRWLGAGSTVDGDTLVFARREEHGETIEEVGRTVERSPPGRWVLAVERLGAGWPSALRLVVEIEPAGAGSRVSVLEDGFQNLPLSIGLTVWERSRRRWREALERLAAEIKADS